MKKCLETLLKTCTALLIVGTLIATAHAQDTTSSYLSSLQVQTSSTTTTGSSQQTDTTQKKDTYGASNYSETLIGEVQIVVFSSISLLENGSAVLGGLLIGASLVGEAYTTTYEGAFVTMPLVMATGFYNLHMQSQDFSSSDRFRNNIIAGQVILLSMVADQKFGHQMYKSSSKTSTLRFNIVPYAGGIGGLLSYKW